MVPGSNRPWSIAPELDSHEEGAADREPPPEDRGVMRPAGATVAAMSGVIGGTVADQGVGVPQREQKAAVSSTGVEQAEQTVTRAL
jgi:hypothetical protein